MKQNMNVTILQNLLDLWRKTKEDRNFDTMYRKFDKLVATLNQIFKLVEEEDVLYKKNVHLFDSFAYVGEFFERYKTNGFEMNEGLFSAMCVFYAVGKSTNAFEDVDFNNYQIEDFEKMLEESIIENEYIDYARYLLTLDEKHIENLILKSEKANPIDFIWALEFLPENEKNFIFKYTKARQTMFFELKNDFEKNYPIISSFVWQFSKMKLCREKAFLKEVKNEIPILGCLLTCLDGKSILDKTKKEFMALGFTSNNVYSINFLFLKKNNQIGMLKLQKAAMNTIEFLISSEEDFNNIDEFVINIISFMKFSINMDGGKITSVRDMFKIGNYQNRIKSINNYKIFVKMLSTFNFTFDKDITIYLNVLEDGFYFEKLNCLIDILKTKTIVSLVFTRACNEIFDCKLMEVEKKKEKLMQINQVLKRDFEMELVDLFSDFEIKSTSTYFYNSLCNIGFFDPLTNLKESKVLINFSNAYFVNNKSILIYDAIRFLKDSGQDSFVVLDKNLCTRENGDYLENFLVQELDVAKKREMIDIVLEDVLMKHSKTSFYTFLLNLLFFGHSEIKKIYSKEEVENLYHIGIEFLENYACFDSSPYSNKNRYKYNIDKLEEIYMTEEEKERIKKEKELALLEKEKLEMEEEIKKIEDVLSKCIIEKNNSGYENEKTRTSLEFYQYTLRLTNLGFRSYSKHAKYEIIRNFIKEEIILNPVVYKENTVDFFELLGEFVDCKIITLEEAAKSIASIQYLEDIMEKMNKKIA